MVQEKKDIIVEPIPKTTIKEVEYAEDIQEFIAISDDVSIASALKEKIMCLPKDELVLVTKTIGYYPIIIESVEIYTQDFLVSNF
jgi:hypothetical protein